MSPLIERFISLVLSGYGKQREKLGPRAREELMARLHSRSGVAGQEEALAEACEQLERNPPTQSRWAAWRAIAFNLTPLLVLLAVSWWYLPDYYLDGPPKWLPASEVRRIEERQTSLVLRPLPARPAWRRFENLPFLPADSHHPPDPEEIQMVALFAPSKPDFDWHTAWRQADPDNSWYLLQQANALAQKAVDEANRKYSRLARGASRPPLDPATVAEMLPLCEEAARLPHFIDYTQRPLLRQITCLLPPRTSSENRFEYFLLPQNRTGVLESLCEALLAELKERDKNGDKEGVIRLAKLIRRIALLTNQQTGASDAGWNSYAYYFRAAAIERTLMRQGPASALPVLGDLSDRIRQAYDRSTKIEVSGYSSLQWDRVLKEGLASHRYPAVPRERDFMRPERLLGYNEADQHFAWFLSLVSAAGLLLISGFQAMADRASPGTRAGSILAYLHRPGAFVRIFFFGFIVPIFGWLIVMVATPLSMRDLSDDFIETPDWMKGGVWLFLMLSGPLLSLTATLFLARREVHKRFAFLGLRSPDLLTGRISLGLAAIIPALFGIARWMTSRDLQSRYESAVAGLLGLVAIAFLFRFVSPLLHFRSAALGSVLTFRLVRPVLWALSIATALSIPAMKQYEARWISELPPGDGRVDTPQWLHDHTQAFRIAIREEFANEPPYTGE